MASAKMKKFMKEVWGKRKGLTLKEITYFIKLGCKDLPVRSIEKVTRLVLKTGLQRGLFTRQGHRYKILERQRVRLLKALSRVSTRRRRRNSKRSASGPFDARHVMRRMRSVQGRRGYGGGRPRLGHAHTSRRAGAKTKKGSKNGRRRRRKVTRKSKISKPKAKSSKSGEAKPKPSSSSVPNNKPNNPEPCPKPAEENKPEQEQQ